MAKRDECAVMHDDGPYAECATNAHRMRNKCARMREQWLIMFALVLRLRWSAQSNAVKTGAKKHKGRDGEVTGVEGAPPTCIRTHSFPLPCIHGTFRIRIRICVHSICIHNQTNAYMHCAHCLAQGVPDQVAYENFNREQKRKKSFAEKTDKTTSNLDLLNFARKNALPANADALVDNKMYAVGKLAERHTEFPETTAICLLGKTNVGWIKQLVNLDYAWALHADGKHKLHHGRWILITFGTHCLHWNLQRKVCAFVRISMHTARCCSHSCTFVCFPLYLSCMLLLVVACCLQMYTHSFRPLIYMFAKNIETVESVKMAMFGLQVVATMYCGERLMPAVNISDHSDGLRSGMQYINVNWESGEQLEEAEEMPHMSDWAHIAVHYAQGRLLPKSNPYYGACWHYLEAIHLAHSTEQMDLLICLLTYVQMRMRRECAANAPRMRRECATNAPRMRPECTQNAPRMLRECAANARLCLICVAVACCAGCSWKSGRSRAPYRMASIPLRRCESSICRCHGQPSVSALTMA